MNQKINQKSKSFTKFLILTFLFPPLIALLWTIIPNPKIPIAPPNALAKLYLKGTPETPGQVTFENNDIGFDSDGDSTPDMIINTAGNVGIGTTNPQGVLDVGGGNLVIASTGNVGIGTTSPGSKLEVSGDTRFGCRSGFWSVADGRICVESTLRGPSDAHSAIGTCKGVTPGCRVCTHNDLQQACGSGVSNPYGASSGWYGDHGTTTLGNWDDEYGVWNSNGCADNNDGPAYHYNGLSVNFRCCYGNN